MYIIVEKSKEDDIAMLYTLICLQIGIENHTATNENVFKGIYYATANLLMNCMLK